VDLTNGEHPSAVLIPAAAVAVAPGLIDGFLARTGLDLTLS
jgi:hypothetical protein